MKVIDIFADMDDEELAVMASIEAESRNLKDRNKPAVKRRVAKVPTGAGNFLKLQAAKTATA